MKPDSGYELDELTVTDAKGKEVKGHTKRSETTYTFQMPDSKVTVEGRLCQEDGTVVEQPLFSTT